MSHIPLRALTLTHVRYQKGDYIGYFLAWVSLVPVFISLCGFTCHLMFRRELQGLFFAVGLLISQFINELIKSTFKQARPPTCELLESCDSHGWPSSHSQFMFFFSVYYTLLTHTKLGVLSRNQMGIAAFVVWPMAVLTLISRVYLGYHSVVQVFAGATLGAILGGGWFWIVNYQLRPLFPMIEESPIGSMLYFKDTSHIPHVLKFEYENARGARKHSSYKRSE